MADPKQQWLKHAPIFAQCSKSELQTLVQNTDDVSLPAGRTLTTEGRSNGTFYILTDGEVEVSIKGESVGRLGPGDVLGEISMLDMGPATATTVTATPVRALVMSHLQFRQAIRGQDAIALKVIGVMAERLRADTRHHA